MATAAEPATAAARHPAWMESWYERLAEDDEGRVCTAISAAACREAPGNFFRILLAQVASQLADKLASAKTTLPWLLMAVGAPAWMLSLLVPIRESGSMLPQMAIGGWVRRRARRKGVWVAGAAVQGASLVAMAGAASTLQGTAAGAAIIALLCVFALARGACSVAFKDVQGKTLPKTRRGRLAGWAGAAAGALAMAAGLGLARLEGQDSAAPYAALLLAAAVLWGLAAVAFARIVEEPGATEGGASGLGAAFARLTLLRDDLPFRRFVIARALAMGSGLAAPFYLALAQQQLGGAMALLGLFIAVEGLAGLLSAPLWGRWADRSSRGVFALGCALAGGLSLAVAALAWAPLSPGAALFAYPLAFFGLGVAHAGIRLGRKTYLVDMAEGNRRTDCVAVSNTVIGALLLGSALVGALAASVSVPATVALLGAAGLAGAALSLRWKPVSG